MNTIIQPIPIFKVGRHTDMSGTTLTITEADLAQTVAAYQPARHEAPLVVGHPQHDAPSWGWVASLALVDGTLLATPHQVDPAFAELVMAGRYKKISASFYTPHAPSNPHPGVYYLRHVGFLGAQPPAVKGLPDVMFRETRLMPGDETSVVVWETTTDWSEPVGATDCSPSPTLNKPMENTMPPSSEAESLSAIEAEWQRRTEELQTREAQFAEREERLRAAEAAWQRQQTMTGAAQFVEALVQQGRVLPRQREGLVAFIASLDPSEQVEFAEPGGEEDGQPVQVKSSAIAYLQRFLQELPVQVEFQERSAVDQSAEPALAFAAPEGYAVDASGLEMHRTIAAYAKQHNLDFAGALLALNK
ncbi:MAG: hypothetical protein H7838_02310 [Magnetococcus sp. DMHC-8]